MIRPAAPDYFKDFYERAGKNILHLNYLSLTNAEIKQEWKFITLTNDLLAILERFADSADQLKLHPHVKRDLLYWNDRIKPVLSTNAEAVRAQPRSE